MNEKDLRKILSKLGIEVVNKSGKWLEFCCPFAKWTHKKGTDSNASAGAVIDLERPSNFKCHSCKKKGMISSLVRTLENYRDKSYPGLAFEADMADARNAFGDFDNREQEDPDELPPHLNEIAYKGIYGRAWDYEEARAYLKKRNIGKKTSDYLELGYDPEEMRIIFPVRHTDNKLYGFSGRSILKDEQFPYKKYKKVRDYNGLPKRHLLLGAELVDRKKPNFVHEGLFGHAHLFEIGADEYVNPLAMMGSEMTRFKAEILMDLGNMSVLCPDNDEAGDACLFGTYNTHVGGYEGGGAVDILERHIPLVVPEWPMGKPDKKGNPQRQVEKDDIDQLDIHDIKEMAFETDLWRPRTLTKNPTKAKKEYAQ